MTGVYAYTSPWFDKLTVDTSTFFRTGDRPLLLCFENSLKAEMFDVLRDRADFQELADSVG